MMLTPLVGPAMSQAAAQDPHIHPGISITAYFARLGIVPCRSHTLPAFFTEYKSTEPGLCAVVTWHI